MLNFEWCRELFVWEGEALNSFIAVLNEYQWAVGEDRWKWRAEEEGLFTVKSAYKSLERRFILERKLSVLEKGVFQSIWKSLTPLKVVAFSWKLLLDRIPTRSNLAKRNIIPTDNPTVCVFCDGAEETTTHLFLHCQVVRAVSVIIMRWLSFELVTPQNMLEHSVISNEEARNNKVRKGWCLIWHVTVRVIWKSRNNVIFNNDAKGGIEMVEEIKVMSWIWCLHRVKIPSCLFYVWCWNPKDCLLRKLMEFGSGLVFGL